MNFFYLIERGLKILHQDMEGLKFSQKVLESLPGPPQQVFMTTPLYIKSRSAALSVTHL